MLFSLIKQDIICTHTHTHTHMYVGSGSSVGIATDYGMDGPGSNPCGDEIFRPFRAVKWVKGLSRG